jgi:Flp pilus assembly protein TadG
VSLVPPLRFCEQPERRPCRDGCRSRGWRCASTDAGSLSVELVIAVPLLLLVLSLVFAYGRIAQVTGSVEAGARDAARLATQARTSDDARSAAEATLQELAASSGGPCRDIQVDVEPVEFAPDVSVTVTVDCDYSLADLGLPGVPGTLHAGALFTSPLDPNRGVGP